MKAAAVFWFLLGIWTHILFGVEALDDLSLGKRYLAALAKNGHLPKFNHHQKKREGLDELEEKTGFSLNQISLPSVVDPEQYSELIFELPEDIASEYFPSWESKYVPEKRNVAALARLGRLNSIRYGRYQPHYVSGKRVSVEDDNGIDTQVIDKNELDEIDVECLPYDDDENKEEIDAFFNGKQKKRYVAALARSGRLPVWHSQRMWGGRKRDDSYPAFRSNSRMDIDNDLDNTISEMPYFKRKQKRCKKLFGYKRQKRSVEKFTEEENILDSNPDILVLNNQEEKRNVAALARNGKLPMRRYGKRTENTSGSKILQNNKEDSQNLAALTPNEKSFESGNSDDKRNIATLARNGKLITNSFSEEKRNIAISYDNEFNVDDKRNVAALARNAKLPAFYNVNGKRNIQALARNGKLPAFTDKKRNSDEVERDETILDQYREDKKNVAYLARNGKIPPFNKFSDKRNVAALARNGKLPGFSFAENKRNLAALARNGKLPGMNQHEDKRNIASLARDGKLRSLSSNEDKRNIAYLAQNGNLNPFHIAENKRNIAALARNGKLPMFQSGEDKRNIAALARNGKLPSLRYVNEKRNLAALARNNKLPAFYSRAEKRNIAALAQGGKLPSFNSIEEKREVFPFPKTYYQETKRNIAALARKGQLHFKNLNGKRSVASLVRNEKLFDLNQRDKNSVESEISDEKWEEGELEENKK